MNVLLVEVMVAVHVFCRVLIVANQYVMNVLLHVAVAKPTAVEHVLMRHVATVRKIFVRAVKRLVNTAKS